MLWRFRKEIILVIDDEPITWNAAYVEIKNKVIIYIMPPSKIGGKDEHKLAGVG